MPADLRGIGKSQFCQCLLVLDLVLRFDIAGSVNLVYLTNLDGSNTCFILHCITLFPMPHVEEVNKTIFIVIGYFSKITIIRQLE